MKGSRDGYGEVKCIELDMRTGTNSYIEIRIIARVDAQWHSTKNRVEECSQREVRHREADKILAWPS